ncbi:MAG: rod shape-determining protein MreD [Acidobacteriota bacterium]|jgi:rod shape-determining protein MreD|nr:rod shape-determining protein MreD [Acidobacteriota bacterium]MDT5262508.1 rod shape-determining protein MreD [Acidobacteriota bacterium]MDT7778151.1 rod shape-determining protein MreD [Acidobacteriota bacterium]
MKWKLAVCVAVAVVLQSSLSALWQPFMYADLSLIVVVYFALQRDAVLAVVIGTVAGLATDMLSRGLLGARGFSMTLTAYLVAALVTRVMIDNALLRIPVLAGAAGFNTLIYLLLHQLLGQQPTPLGDSIAETIAYSVIWTTVIGTAVAFLLDTFFSESTRVRQRRAFAFRRRIARRGLGRRK